MSLPSEFKNFHPLIIKNIINTIIQFISQDNSEYISLSLPGPMLLFKFLFILVILSPWIAILSNRINFKDVLEFLFGARAADSGDKKSNGFF